MSCVINDFQLEVNYAYIWYMPDFSQCAPFSPTRTHTRYDKVVSVILGFMHFALVKQNEDFQKTQMLYLASSLILSTI